MSTLTSRFGDIANGMEAKAAAAVQHAGLRVEAGAKRRARVDTGFMRGELRWRPEGPLEGSVIAGAKYTIHHEYGTRHMSAQPMLVPAVEDARQGFEHDIADIFR